MTRFSSLFSSLFVLMLAAASAPADTFDLDHARLAPALDELTEGERHAVGDAIALIRNDEHGLALARLSSLKQANPQNSSLRILAAYALLQVGNLVGAFEEAEKAHTAPNGNSYRCWFLAKVALLNGKKSRCERELEHLKRIGDMAAEAAELEKELARK